MTTYIHFRHLLPPARPFWLWHLHILSVRQMARTAPPASLWAWADDDPRHGEAGLQYLRKARALCCGGRCPVLRGEARILVSWARLLSFFSNLAPTYRGGGHHLLGKYFLILNTDLYHFGTEMSKACHARVRTLVLNQSPSPAQQRAGAKDQYRSEKIEDPCAGAAGVGERDTCIVRNRKLIDITDLTDPRTGLR